MNEILIFLLGVTLTAAIIFGILLHYASSRSKNLEEQLKASQKDLEESRCETQYSRGMEVGRTSDFIYRKIQRNVETGKGFSLRT